MDPVRSCKVERKAAEALGDAKIRDARNNGRSMGSGIGF